MIRRWDLFEALRRSPVWRGVATSYANTAVTALSNLVAIPLYLRFLGKEEYGIWLATSSVTAYLGLLNLGITQTTATRFGASRATGDHDGARSVLGTGFWCFCRVTWPLAALVALAGAIVPAEVMFRGLEAAGHARLIVTVAAGTMLLELPFSVLPACLRASGGIEAQQRIASVQTIARVIAGAGTLGLGAGLPAAIALQSLVNVAASLGALVRLRADLPRLNLSPSWFKSNIADQMRSPSRYFFLLQISSGIAFGSDQIIISAVIGPGAVTAYAVAQRLVNIGTSLVATVSANFGPAFLRCFAVRDTVGLWRLYRKALLVSIAAGAVGGGVMLLAGPPFIRLWVGPGAYVGFWPLAALVGVALVQTILYPADALLTVTAQHRHYAMAAAWEAGLNLVLSIVLCQRIGVAGVALASVLARFFGAGPVMIVEAGRMLRPRTSVPTE